MLFVGMHSLTLSQQTLLFPLALVLLTACQNGAGTDNVHGVAVDGTGLYGEFELHPTPGNIPAVTDPRFIIHDDSQDTLLWVLAALRGGHTVGVADGDLDDMIGTIRDVAVSDSLVYYVDGSYSHVRAYNSEGHLVDIIGGPGEGPGEFSLVRKVAVTDTGQDVHVVVGSGARTVSVFSRNQGGSHEFRTSFRVAVAFANSDMCAMHGHVYTPGYSEDLDGVIHKYTLEGEYVSSFGERYNDPHLIVRAKMAEGGNMECNTTHHTLLYTHPNAPIATAFAESGDIIWQIRLADARIASKGARYIETGHLAIGSLPPLVDESGHLEITGGARGNSFWLTRRERLSEDGARWANHFYKVDVLSGYGKYLGVHPVNFQLSSGIIVRTMDQDRLYTSRSSPYPQLGIHPIPSATR